MKRDFTNIIFRTALLSLLIAALTGLSGCRMGPNDYSCYHDIDPDGWRYGDTLRYNLDPRDSLITGDIVLSLRHTNDYIYSNIFLEVIVADSLGSRCDTLAVTLADDFGRWYGRGIGTDYQVSDTVARRITLRRPVTIGVRHIMRDEVLTDIEQIGISFVETLSK
ncbi:MAG: gliding motility lipoprotein GldH [Muribaculaceae bacterium]|nr:gliding motility lipoprotein GldH [Muribaculaceae bacterium]